MPLRLSFAVTVPASGSMIMFPTPQMDNYLPSYLSLVGTSLTPIWSLTANSLDVLGGTITATRTPFTDFPFARSSILDGVSGRCTKYTIKMTYVGPLLNRSGTVYIYEEPSTDIFGRNEASTSTFFNSYMEECVNSSTQTRNVSLTKCPEVIADFHPVLWQGDNTHPGAPAEGWHRPIPGNIAANDSSCLYNGSSNFSLGAAAPVARAPGGFVAIQAGANALELRVDIVAHYELSGGVARPMSTTSSPLPSQVVDTMKSALTRAKFRHIHNPHDSFEKVANRCLADVTGSRNGGPKVTVGGIAKAGASLASLFL